MLTKPSDYYFSLKTKKKKNTFHKVNKDHGNVVQDTGQWVGLLCQKVKPLAVPTSIQAKQKTRIHQSPLY